MFNDYEAIIDDETTDETTGEYDGGVEESDYPTPKNSFPPEVWASRVTQAEKEGPVIRKELQELEEKLRETTKEKVETKILLENWSTKLQEWQKVIARRIIPNAEDLATIRTLEENAAKAELKWEAATRLIEEIEARKKALRPLLARVQMIEDLTDSKVLSVNIFDELWKFPTPIAQVCAAVVTTLRRNAINVQDYDINQRMNQIQQIQNGRMEGSPIESNEEDRIRRLQEEIANFEEEIRVCDEAAAVYMMMFRHYYDEAPDQKQRYIYAPFTKAVLRQNRDTRAEENRIQKEANRKAQQAAAKEFNSATEPSF